LYEQLIKVCNEYSLNAVYKNIFLLTGKELFELILKKDEEKIQSLLSKKVVVSHYPNLKNNEFLICSATEVLYKNCHESNNIENFSDYLINSTDDLKKKKSSENNNNLDTKKKRVSYRAKANDFGEKKNVKKTESTKNVDKSRTDNLEQIEVLSKNNNKKIEKRQGWWNQ
jgi:hypothetical protein